MPKSAVSEFDSASQYPIPENTLVPVQLQSCTSENVTYTNKKTGKPDGFMKWDWTFMVTDGEYAGTSFRASTEPKVTSSLTDGFPAPALPIVQALLQRELQIGEEVDTDLLVGLTANATVRHLEPRARKNGDGFWYNVELAEIFPPYPEAQAVSGTVVQGGAPAYQYDQPPY